MKTSAKKIAVLEALGLAFVWSLLTVAGRVGLSTYTPEAVILFRFGGTLLLLVPILTFAFLSSPKAHRRLLLASAPPGIFLSLTIILQTWGLGFTSVSKTGFILSLYVVFVPVLEAWVLKATLNRKLLFYIGIILIGMGLISHPTFDNLQGGDLLMFLGAFFAACQVVAIGYFGRSATSSVYFCLYQMFWSSLLPMLFLFFHSVPWDTFVANFSGKGVAVNLAVLFLIVGSFITFFFQIKSQKVLNSTEAGLLFLQEAPFSALLGALFFGDHMTVGEWLGAGLIFGTSLLTIAQIKNNASPSEEREREQSSVPLGEPLAGS